MSPSTLRPTSVPTSEPTTTLPTVTPTTSIPTVVNSTKAPHKPPSRSPTLAPTPTAMKVSSSSVAGQSGGSYVTAIFAGAIGGVVFIVVAIIFLVRVCDTSSAAAKVVATGATTTPNNTSTADPKKDTNEKTVSKRGVFSLFSTENETKTLDTTEPKSPRVAFGDIYSEGVTDYSHRNPSIAFKNF